MNGDTDQIVQRNVESIALFYLRVLYYPDEQVYMGLIGQSEPRLEDGLSGVSFGLAADAVSESLDRLLAEAKTVFEKDVLCRSMGLTSKQTNSARTTAPLES